MKIAVFISMLSLFGPTSAFAGVETAEKELLSAAAGARDLENFNKIVGELRVNGYTALTQHVTTRTRVKVMAMPNAEGGPIAKLEGGLRGRYVLRVAKIVPGNQNSIWTVAEALTRLEIALRGRADLPGDLGATGTWLTNPKVLSDFRSEQIAPVINDTYRLLGELDQINPAQVLPELDPALWMKTLRAIGLGSPRTAPNMHDFERHFSEHGAPAVRSMLFERYEREMLIAAWRKQALGAGWRIALVAAVGTPLVYYISQHLPRHARGAGAHAAEADSYGQEPTDPRVKQQIRNQLQALINEVHRRKEDNIRFPDTAYINEAKQAVVDFINTHYWLAADPLAPKP